MTFINFNTVPCSHFSLSRTLVKDITIKTFKDESMFELACDKVTRQGYWVLDPSDRKYVDQHHYPKKQMCFIAMGSALKKPFVELIPMGEKLNAQRFNVFFNFKLTFIFTKSSDI